jgi:hypothetical protein
VPQGVRELILIKSTQINQENQEGTHIIEDGDLSCA